MTIIIVDDGKMEVYCKDREQAIAYIDELKHRGYKNFILMEENHEQQSERQVREDIQEPIESYENSFTVGL